MAARAVVRLGGVVRRLHDDEAFRPKMNPLHVVWRNQAVRSSKRSPSVPSFTGSTINNLAAAHHSASAGSGAGPVSGDLQDRKVFSLLYTYVEGILEKRVPHRPQHLALCTSLQEEGLLILGGALGDPPTQALFVFRAAGPDEIESKLVRRDPYFIHGLVTDYTIMPWSVVVGSLASTL